jgi:uncharacterized protein
MKLSDGERLLVVMLAEVMEAMSLNRELDPSLIKMLAINHDDWAIAHKYQGIFDSEAPPEGVVRETHEILWMWQVLEDSIANLEGADAEEAAGWHYHKFIGFDGNHDRHFGVTHTLVKDLDLYSDFKDRGFNSHSQATLPRYREILAKFDTAMQGNHGEPLKMSQLREILG